MTICQFHGQILTMNTYDAQSNASSSSGTETVDVDKETDSNCK